MANSYGPKGIVTDGLIFAVDAGNEQCWQYNTNTSGSCTSLTNSLEYTGSIFGSTSSSLGEAGSFSFTGTGAPDVSQNIFINYDFGIPEPVTFSFWMKPIANRDQTILNSGPNFSALQDQRLEIHILSPSKLMQYVRNGEGGKYSSSTYDIGIWNYWVFAQGAFQSSVNIYKNGVFDVNRTLSNASDSAQTEFSIGRGNFASGNLNITCVSIYDRQLTAAEILQNYNSQKGRFGL